jgi:hypothetical protein
MRKLIIWLTIFSVMNLIGCYYQEQMNPGDYTFDENSTVKITTKDTVYNFTGDDYYLGNDTLIGELSTKLDKKTTLITDVEIPLKDIEKLEIERNDAVLTTLTVIGALVLVLFVGTMRW